MPKRQKGNLSRSRAVARPNAAARGYCSAAWQRIRVAVIARDAGQCRSCHKIIDQPGDAHVDHIIEKPRGTDALENLRLLCRSCHSSRHAADSIGR